jgi:hypothetical protein
MRDLAGATEGARDRSLAAYADAILEALEDSGASVGTSGILGGSDKLNDPQPAAEWAASARKEAVWLTFRASSREELLERLTRTKFGSDWMIRVGDQKPVPLRQWAEQNVVIPATAPAAGAAR